MWPLGFRTTQSCLPSDDLDDGTSGFAGTTASRYVLSTTKAFTIEIRSAPIAGEYRSEKVVNDVSGVPAEPGLSDEERWRKPGFTPEGKPLGPMQLQ